MLTHSNPVLSVRVSQSERDILEMAAEQARRILAISSGAKPSRRRKWISLSIAR